ncbi:hypothetical protein OCH239_13100 [Roseivivax halodurans JCM 10272]|uniref:Uncharacterized protein n=1 Tax=Roseivivax halodurans JCM 10272 TaxID=1449350 RepID=X7EDF2_9RHOB|nr:hypothetical protein OCH239_13100 [Roseivivax halodurans JCM 10272]
MAYHAFAHGLSDTQKNRLPLAYAKAMPHLWLGEALKEDLEVFVSSEALCRQLTAEQGPWHPRREGYLARLAVTLSNFEVIPILVFRRPDDFVRSFYQ